MKLSTSKILKAIGTLPSPDQVSNIQKQVNRASKNIHKSIDQFKGNQAIVINTVSQLAHKIDNNRLKYLKLGIQDLRSIVTRNSQNLDDFPKKFLLGEKLVKSNIIDVKIAGINLWIQNCQYINIPILKFIKQEIINTHIPVWKTQDDLARLIKYSSLHNPFDFDNQIFSWSQDERLLVRQVCMRSFRNRIRLGNSKPNYKGFIDKVVKMCQYCVVCKEASSQRLVSTLIAELIKLDRHEGLRFLRKYSPCLTDRSAKHKFMKHLYYDQKKQIRDIMQSCTRQHVQKKLLEGNHQIKYQNQRGETAYEEDWDQAQDWSR